jgi:hypothetical protein
MGTGVMFRENCGSVSRGSGESKGLRISLIDFVAREAARHSEPYMRHLITEGFTPQPAEFFDIGEGCLQSPQDVDDFVKWLRAAMKLQVELHHKADGSIEERPLRVTTTVLGTAMASWPESPAVAAGNPVAQEWAKRSIDFAQELYGDRLVAAIGHHDESKWHLHFLFHNDGANVKPMLAACKASKEWKDAGNDKGGGEAAARGNRALLNAYQQHVGAHVGLDRFGPTPGLKSENWRARKKREAKEEKERLAQERENLKAQATKLAQVTQESESFIIRRDATSTKIAQDALAALEIGNALMAQAQSARRMMLEIIVDSKAKSQVTAAEAQEMASFMG